MIASENKSRLLTNLKKSRGSVEKVIQMVESDAYCLDIAQQLNASMGLLRRANGMLLKNHLQTCGAHRLGSSKKKVRDEFVDEFIRAFDITSRK
ncbi:metal-sensitive transcriptional regulator [Candidatus Gracilibacteria bacterium]|nr:metal-sensitive transcriptional regulator [Candidatus Gracilibacteria bacterium]